MKWLVWSFEALLIGKHPNKDPDGRPLKKESVFYQQRGQPLVPGGYKGVLWAIQGDHEMFSNVLKLPHWRNFHPCWECDCCADSSKKFKVIARKTYTVIQPRLQEWIAISNADALASPKSAHPLFQIPGVTTRFVRGDLLHILWHNGVYSHLLGSILHYMCFTEPSGTLQRVHPATRLGIIFLEIQKHYKQSNAPTRLTNLKLSMFTSVKSPWAKHPTLNAKAAESKHLAPALLDVCKNVLSRTCQVDQKIVSALQNMCEVVNLFDRAEMFLTDSESTLALNLALDFFDDYAWLHSWAEGQERKLFKTGALKFHTLFHLVENAKFINPRFHWTFRNEDFVGKISQLTHSVSMGVRATKLSLKAFPSTNCYCT